MIIVKNKALIIVLVLLSSSILGYEIYQRYNEDDEPRVSSGLIKLKFLVNQHQSDFGCETYVQPNSTPVKTLYILKIMRFGLQNWMVKYQLGL